MVKAPFKTLKYFVRAANLDALHPSGSVPDEKSHAIVPTRHIVKIFPNKGRTRVLLRHCCHNDYRYDSTHNYKKKACLVSVQILWQFDSETVYQRLVISG
jgi:hypothetical protein